MKKTILIFIILIIFATGFAQNTIERTYKIDNLSEKISYYLEFTKDGCYSLELNEQKKEGNSFVYSIILSSGTYELINNEIVLKDKEHGFEIKLKLLKDKSIIVEQGFPSLQFQVFICEYENYAYYKCNHYKTTLVPIKQEQEREEYQQDHPILYPFDFGFYIYEGNESNWNLNAYELDIQKEGMYRLYHKTILISEGKWSRKGNILSLYDTYLQHPFYLLITPNGLLSKYLPGDSMGKSMLKYSNYKNFGIVYQIQKGIKNIMKIFLYQKNKIYS